MGITPYVGVTLMKGIEQIDKKFSGGLSRLAIGVIAVVLISALFSPAHAVVYRCSRVLDGDTIHVMENGQAVSLRLVGIDAPEVSHGKNQPGQPFSQTATKYLAALVLNKPVEFKDFGTDRYGRRLAVVFVDGREANLELLKAGLAEVYRGAATTGQPMASYWQAEKEARDAGRGMWALKERYVSPREWRAKYKGPAAPKWSSSPRGFEPAGYLP
jgi:endonuclease YncB( thermonuclease family)